jgi:hypothetical protein
MPADSGVRSINHSRHNESALRTTEHDLCADHVVQRSLGEGSIVWYTPRVSIWRQWFLPLFFILSVYQVPFLAHPLSEGRKAQVFTLTLF